MHSEWWGTFHAGIHVQLMWNGGRNLSRKYNSPCVYCNSRGYQTWQRIATQDSEVRETLFLNKQIKEPVWGAYCILEAETGSSSPEVIMILKQVTSCPRKTFMEHELGRTQENLEESNTSYPDSPREVSLLLPCGQRFSHRSLVSKQNKTLSDVLYLSQVVGLNISTR